MTRVSTVTMLLLAGLCCATATAGDAKATTGAARAKKPRMTREQALAMGAGGGSAPETGTSLYIVPGVDMSLLSPEQKIRASKLLTSEKCNCGCGLTLYECRTDDETCPFSKPLAQGIVDKILAGKTDAEIVAQPLEPAPTRLAEAARHDFDLAGAPSLGPANAKVTVVEFADFQCELCGLAHTWVPKVLEIYPNDVRYVFQHLPAPGHRNAMLAAQASMAAHAQGKFWPMHDRIYAEPTKVSKANVLQWAKEIGLDVAAFTKALDADQFSKAILADVAEATAAKVDSTPAFFINGHRLIADPSYESLRDVIEEALAK